MSIRDTLPCDIKARFTNTRTGAVTTRNFRLTKVLGKGGMATVYLGTDDRPRSLLDREEPAYVAIKYPTDCPPDVDGKPPEMHSRFVRECAVLRDLHHQNIIHVHDLWRDQEGQTFIEMEYVPEAQTLEEIINLYRARFPQGTRAERSVVPMRLALGIARQLLEGMDALHTHGVVHRDLKPGNFLLTKRAGGFLVKIMDFGIAKDLQADVSGGPKLTQEHAILGTPYYMSPEQVLSTAVKPSSDLWAFGVVLYELVTGELPFPAVKNPLDTTCSNLKAHTLEVWLKITQQDFVPVETLVDKVDPDIVRIIAGCLRKEPQERMTVREAQALIEMAEDTQREEDARADLDTLPGGAPPSARRRSKLMAAAEQRKSPVPEVPPPSDRSRFVDVEAPEDVPTATKPLVFPYHYLVAAAMFVAMGVFGAWSVLRHAPETPVASPAQASPMAEPIATAAPTGTSVQPAVSAPEPAVSSKSPPGVGPPAGSKEDATYRSGLAHASKKECRVADLELLATISRYPGLLPALKAEAECLTRTGDRTRAQKYAAIYLQYEGTDVADFSPALRALVKR
ncbi:MAG: serine/threonine-protein kinase [Patescibacteria group bacterium]